MSKQFGSIALAAAVLVAGAGAQSNIARAAEECLAAPNARPPQGSHWYYRTDRVKQQKCWYLRSPGQTAQQVAPEDTAEAVPAAQSASALMSSTATNSFSPKVQAGTITPQPVTATFDDAAKRS